MDCRVPQSCSLVMKRPGPSSPEILSPEKFSPVSGKVLDGRDGLLGCLLSSTLSRGKTLPISLNYMLPVCSCMLDPETC